ncbi:hypothetical protein SeLEV6574_g03224 [Synchytrium endobioticum]|uniref:Aminopeptidase n=1 Tax=Synchytrium endobioticum TaxID=286115 RepID=A0A507D4Y9_9FUNG|nr:hypothetical protein SeLEV6574_g03224 [Synchytrium endobioticum]
MAGQVGPASASASATPPSQPSEAETVSTSQSHEVVVDSATPGKGSSFKKRLGTMISVGNGVSNRLYAQAQATSTSSSLSPPVEGSETDPLIPRIARLEESTEAKRRRIRLIVINSALVLLSIAAALVIVVFFLRKASGSEPLPSPPPQPPGDVPGDSPNQPIQKRLPNWLVPYQYDLDILADIGQGTFAGIVHIYTSIIRPTDKVLFHAVGLQIKESSVVSATDVPLQNRKTADVVEYDPTSQTHTMQLPTLLQAGNYTIRIEYAGIMQKIGNYYGFFQSEYYDRTAKVHRIGATHFETTGARYAYPCMDEPALKARFNINITAEQQFTVLSNAAEVKNMLVDHLEDGHGRKWIKHIFHTTPPMSTYLAAWVVGELDNLRATTHNTTSPITVTVYSQLGRAFEGAYALFLSLDILDTFEALLAMPLPLNKLDMVPIPDFPFEGMENLGLIIFDDGALSVNSKYATTAEVELRTQDTALLVAHEIAHQYFGDMKTQNWWNEIFLAEGLAEFYQFKGAATDLALTIQPQFVKYEHIPAFKADVSRFAHPLVPNAADTIPVYSFDEITYDKGASLLRMLESWMGGHDEACGPFCRGIQNYVAAGSSVRSVEDMWSALEGARKDLNSQFTIADIMEGWIRQPHTPLLTVENATNSFVINQQPLTLDKDSDFVYTWTVPLEYTEIPDNGSSTRPATVTAVMSPNTSFTVKHGDGNGLFLVNPHRVGLYRVNYPHQLWTRLAQSTDVLSIPERAGLVSDALHFLSTRRLDATPALDTTLFLKKELDSTVWAAAVEGFWVLDASVGMHPTAIVLKNYIKTLVGPVAAELRWVEPVRNVTQPRAAHQRALTRGIVFPVAAWVGETLVLSGAQEYFDMLTTANLTEVLDLPPFTDQVMVNTIYIAVVKYGGPKAFDLIWKNYTTPIDRNPGLLPGDLLTALSWTPDTTNQVKLLGLLPSRPLEEQIKALDALNSASILGHTLVWEYIKTRLDIFNKRPSKALTVLAGSVVSRFSPGLVNEAIQLVENAIPGRPWYDIDWNDGRETSLFLGIRKGIERALVAAKFRDEKRAEVLDWLILNLSE